MSKSVRYTEINAKVWDQWAEEGLAWSIPITHEEYMQAQRGEWGVYLTPCKFVPKEWFGNGMNFLIAEDKEPLVIAHKLPFNPLVNPEQMKFLERDNSGVQFSHSLEDQLGGQLQAGFTLTALYEDRDREGWGVLREYTTQYMATRAVK